MARGIAALLAKADKYDFDPRRVILTGSGFDGDMAAILARQPRYFERAGLPVVPIKGVIIFDCLCPQGLADVLGSVKDPVAEARISASHVEAPRAPAFLFEVVKHDKKGEARAGAMASALTQAGSRTQVEHYDRPRPYARSTEFGYSTNPDNAPLLRFLDAAIGPS